MTAKRGAVRHAAVDKPKPDTVHLPGYLVPTHGERHETCALYSRCLAHHVRVHKRSDPPASCPAACMFREEVTTRATDHMYASGGGPIAQAADNRPW